jgi:hypothetical protein
MRRNLAIELSLAILLIASGSALAESTVAKPVWVNHPGNELRDAAQDVYVLPDGSILVTGWFEDLYESGLTQAPHSFGLRDIFWAKYDAQGRLQWVKSAGSGDCDVSGSISALPDGTFAVSCSYGYSGKNATFGIGEPNQTLLYHYNKYDIALAKCKADGTLLWVRRMGSSGVDLANSVALAPNGGCYVSGHHDLALHLGENDGVDGNEVTLPDGPPDAFLAYYDTNGAFKWAKVGDFGKTEPLSDSSCLVDAFTDVIRYAPDGTELWRTRESVPDPDAFCVVPGTQDFLFFKTGRALSEVWKYRFEAGAHEPTLVWQKDLARYAPNPIIECRPDGSFIIYGANGMLCTFDSAGDFQKALSFVLQGGNLALAPSPADESFYATAYFTSDFVLGAGTTGATQMTHRGSGDIIIAKLLPETTYDVNIGYEGRGCAVLYPPGGHYLAGTNVSVTASPFFSGHDEFDHWEGDFEESTDPVVNLTIEDRDISATAVFAEVPGAPPLPTGSALGLLILSLLPIGLSRFLMRLVDR